MTLQNLFEIFNNKIFRIPDYQRGYSWGKPQLEDLWQDLDILEEQRNHYTGMLSVKKSNSNTYFLVDGQQRITTLIILMKEIYTRLIDLQVFWANEREVKEYKKTFLYKKTGKQGEITEPIFGYEKDNPSDIYFRTKILKIGNTDDSTPDETLYTNNLKKAKEFFEKKLKDKDQDSIEILLKKITENLKFNFYEIEDVLNEFVAFETMNNRGKPLTALELLKNRLIYLSTLLPKNDEEEKEKLRTDINNVWKTVYEYLGKNPEKPIPDDDFLKDHWIMNFPYSRKESNVFKSFLLSAHFTARNVMLIQRYEELSVFFTPEQLDEYTITFQKINDYATDMQEAVKHYYYLHNPTDTTCRYSDDIKKWLTKLNRLGFGAFKPVIVAMLIRNVNDRKITEVLKEMERFIFIQFNLYHRNANYKDTVFYEYAKIIHEMEDVNIEEIDCLLEEIKRLITTTKDLAKIFFDKVTQYQEKYYNWKGLKYFLYEYELSLQEEDKGELKVEWERINWESIEHIYPQTPTDECWRNKFPNNDSLHDSLHGLGNLLLLSTKINSAIQNKCFDVKKERFSTNSYSAIAVSKIEDWTPNEIDTREAEMLKFLDNRWDVAVAPLHE